MTGENNFWPWFSEQEYKNRYARIRAGMKQKNLDCLIIYGIGGYLGTDPAQPNVVYVSSFASFVQTYVVFPMEEHPTLFVTWPVHLKSATHVSFIKDVRVGGMEQTPFRVADRLKELGMEKKRIGIVGAMRWANINLPHDHHLAITEALPDAEFEVVTQWYENLRLIKSEEELAYMKRAAAMTDAAYDLMVCATRPGIRPADLYNVILRSAIEMDGKIPFGHVGATSMKNPDMAYAHPYALTRPINRGDVIMTEIAVGWGGYFGKIWGTYFMGDPTPEYAKMFELAVKTREDLYQAIKPGVKGGELTRHCLDRIQKAGYRSKTCIFGWSNYNSPPDIRSAGDKVTDADFLFQENQCMNIVAYAANKEDTMGVHLADTAVVKKDGIENLQKYPVTEVKIIDK